MKDNSYDGRVVLDYGIPIYDEMVYGFYVNLDDEIKNEGQGEVLLGIGSYVSYLLSVSQFLKGGGKISEDPTEWTLPEHKINVSYNTGMKIYMSVMMDGLINYKIVRIDPIDYEGDCLITDPKVIEQNGGSEVIEIGGEQ